MVRKDAFENQSRPSWNSAGSVLVLVIGLLLLAGPVGTAGGQGSSDTSAHSVRILEPPQGLQVGPLRIGAVVEGSLVDRVRFLLDGALVLTKTRPPYGIEIDVGNSPRPHEITAIALDEAGNELARDSLTLNEGPYRFSVRLIEPVASQTYRDKVRARAEPTLPIGERLERVEFFVGEELLATDLTAPYAVEMPLASHEQSYVRAVAYLTDGNTSEDLVSINARHDSAQLDISFVELFTSALDRKRKPVEGLTGDDFSVFENGLPQEVRRFEQVYDRPVHIGILLDTSTSMIEELPETVLAAREFFERLVRPRDRATVISFADEPRVRVPFSNDPELLAAGLDDLVADGETTLFDSLAFSLYYFGGLKGKRALIVLTDGADSRSRFDNFEVTEYAQRLGVAIYPIGINLGSSDFEVESGLRRLASATGGSSFFIKRARELEQAYGRIETELRSQYLIGYQSTSTVPDAFREVEVKIGRKGIRAHTIPGYYP